MFGSAGRSRSPVLSSDGARALHLCVTSWLLKHFRNFGVRRSSNSTKAPPARPPGSFVRPSRASGSGVEA
eukprot:10577079-Alexandrium_andersonii.AAC.1